MNHQPMSRRETLARTAWGEAANMGSVGMRATINTLTNRLRSGVRWWGSDLVSIALFSYKGIHQYSCWNADNKQLPKILSVTETDPLYKEALRLADLALIGSLDDITKNSTHYVNHLIVKPLPTWCRYMDPLFKLEPHWYYRVVN